MTDPVTPSSHRATITVEWSPYASTGHTEATRALLGAARGSGTE